MPTLPILCIMGKLDTKDTSADVTDHKSTTALQHTKLAICHGEKHGL